MAHRVCPWWIGYLLASPIRRLLHNPRVALQAFVKEGMLVIEPGPGMGFFTLELARLVGRSGKVVAVDIQPKMIEGLRRRAGRKGLLDRVETRLAKADSMGLGDLANTADFVLAFAMIHELPDAVRFLEEMHRVLKPGGKLLAAEPKGHVKAEDFAKLRVAAEHIGFKFGEGPAIRANWTAVLERP